MANNFRVQDGITFPDGTVQTTAATGVGGSLQYAYVVNQIGFSIVSYNDGEPPTVTVTGDAGLEIDTQYGGWGYLSYDSTGTIRDVTSFSYDSENNQTTITLNGIGETNYVGAKFYAVRRLENFNTVLGNYGALDIVDGDLFVNNVSDHINYEQYNVTVNENGVVTMNTARGGLEFGAQPEVGGPTHFHIMRPAGENGSGGTDLYFGDDYNYVLQRPASYNGSPAYGVEIGTNDNDGGDQHVWRFGTDGTLTLPAGGDIKDSNGNSVLGGGSGNTNSLVNGDYTVTLESDGTLTVPSNIVAGQTGFGFNSAINNISLDGSDVFVDLADNVFPGPITGEVVISGVTGTTEANGTWGYQATGPNQFRLYTDSSNSTLVDGSGWGSYDSLGTAVSGISNNLGITVGSKQWEFNADGDLVLPNDGDILRYNGEGYSSVLGGGNSLDPYVTIVDSKVSVTADLDFPASDVAGAIATVDGNFNFGVYFQETTGDASGNMYAVGRSNEDSNYAIVYAFNPNGSVRWKTNLTISGNTQTPDLHNIKLKGDYVYVGFTYYDNDAGSDFHGVAKLVAETGALNYDWIIETPQNTYPQVYDIAINNNDEPIMVGTYGNGLDTLSNVPTKAGGGVNSVIFNNSDLQGYTSQSGWGGQWQVETAPGVFTYPDYINSAYVPVTNVTNPSATGMIAAFRYDQNQNTYWGGVIINDPGTYNVGDQLLVPGSLLFGVDGVNDATWTFNGGQLNGLSGTPSEELKATTWFSWNSPGPNGSQTDFTSSTNVSLKAYLGNQAMIWTPSWNYTYGTTDSEYFYGVAYDSVNDKIYAAGEFWGQISSTYHEGALFKINGSDGAVEWSKYVEDNTGSTDNLRSVLVDSDGNAITVGKNNNGYSLVTKLNNSGDVIWQVRQTNNNNWDNEPRGAIDSDDNVYVTGVWDGSNNYVSIMKLNGNDGSLNWARTFNNSEGYNFYEFYDEDSQSTNIAGTNLYYGGYCYDANDDEYVAVALRLPIDGTATGTYGRWIYAEDTDAQWEDCTSSSNLYTATFPAVTFDGQTLTGELTNSNIDSVGSATATAVAVGGSGHNITNVGGITFADGSTQTTAAVNDPPILWTNPNNNVWRIETYNGGYSGTYDGDDYDARWFDVNNAPSGDNNFRGAIIEYHAYFSGAGTMVGTIHWSRDNNAGDFVTHTEHMSGNSEMPQMSLWFTNGNDRRLYFKRLDGSTQNIMIQWTAKIFYGSESYC